MAPEEVLAAEARTYRESKMIIEPAGIQFESEGDGKFVLQFHDADGRSASIRMSPKQFDDVLNGLLEISTRLNLDAAIGPASVSLPDHTGVTQIPQPEFVQAFGLIGSEGNAHVLDVRLESGTVVRLLFDGQQFEQLRLAVGPLAEIPKTRN